MSGEEEKIRSYFRRGREHQIPFQERKRKSDCSSAEEDKIRLQFGRGR
jgi:hypothetical protein